MTIEQRVEKIYAEAIANNLGEISCKEALRKNLKEAIKDEEEKVIAAINQGTGGFRITPKSYLISVLSVILKPTAFYETVCEIVKLNCVMKVKGR